MQFVGISHGGSSSRPVLHHDSLRVATAIVLASLVCGAQTFPTSASNLPIGYQPLGLVCGQLISTPMADFAMIDSAADSVQVHSLLPGSSCGTSPALVLTTGPGPQQIALGDVDGDGDLDIVTANAANVTILQRTLNQFVRSDQALPTPTARLRLADLDGDGRDDIISGERVIFSTPLGFAFPTTPAGLPVATSHFEPGDYDGDGDIDLAREVVAGPSAAIEIYLNDGSGAFPAVQSTTVPFEAGTSELLRLRLDGDARDDLVRVRSGLPSVEAWHGTAIGQVAAGAVWADCIPTCGLADPLSAARLMNPGAVDSVAVYVGAPHPTPGFRVLTLVGPAFSVVGSLPDEGTHLAFGDLDADGDLDAVQHDGLGQITLSWNGSSAISTGVLTLELLSGDQQTVCFGSASQPIAVRVRDCTGVPVPNVLVSVQVVEVLGAGGMTLPPIVSNALGIATLAPIVSINAGIFDVSLTEPFGSSVTARVSILPPTLSAIVATPGGALEEGPTAQIAASLTNCQGQPAAGRQVTLVHETFEDPVQVGPFISGANGIVSFPISPAAGGGIFDFEMTEASQVSISGTVVVRPKRVVAVSGINQSVQVSTVAAPIDIDIVDANGAPSPFQVVHVASTGFTFAQAVVLTDANGRATIMATAGNRSGFHPIAVRLSSGGAPRALLPMFVSSTRQLSVVSGGDQVTNGIGPFGQPVVFALTDLATGTPIAGATVSFTVQATLSIASGVSLSALSAITDAQGRVSVQPGAVNSLVASRIELNATHLLPGERVEARTYLYIATARATSLDPSFVAVHPGGSPRTHRVSVTTPAGVPVTGEVLTISFVNGLDVAGPILVATDAAGVGTFTWSPGDDARVGLHTIDVVGSITKCHVRLEAAVRELVVRTTSTWAEIRYRRESGPLPIAVVVDLPQAGTGFTPTPYGEVWTSLLSGSPTFVVLDGTGLLGSLDSTVVAQPNFQFLTPLPAQTLGLTFVVQVYAYDPSRPLPGAIVISNPAFLEL